jgi:hypothetical protein
MRVVRMVYGRGWPARQATSWICLVVVLSVMALGLHRTAWSLMPGASVLPDSAATSSRRVVVLVVARDAANGNRIQVRCDTRADRVASDALLVDLKDLADIESRLGPCWYPDDPVAST